MLNEDIHGQRMLLVFFVNAQSLLIQAMFSRNPGNVTSIIVLELVDVADDLALVSSDGREKHQVLQIFIVAEWRWLEYDLLEQLDQLDR